MIPYLRNLIDRHRPEAARPGTSGFVHPRLASRFEGHPVEPPMPGPAIAEPEPATVPDRRALARDEPARAVRPASTQSRGSAEVRRPARPSSTHRAVQSEPPEPGHTGIERTGVLARGPGSRSRRAVTTAEAAGNKLQSRSHPPEPVRHDPQGRTVRGEALPQSASRQPLGDNRDERPGSQGQTVTGDAVETAAAAPAGHPRAEPLATESRQRPGVTVPDIGIGQRFEEREPPGVLQTPDWAAEIQAMLTERQGEPASRAESEPTVNVTIGRIDIRAVRKEQREGTGQATAPSRIMSLDDYLKKRDGRQR